MKLRDLVKGFKGGAEVPKTEKKVLTAQLIQDNLSRFMQYMPNPDRIANGSRASYDTYREMREDPRIKSLLNLLKTTALNYPINITQGDASDNVFQFVKNQPVLTTKLYQKAKRMLASLDYGFSVTEAVWEEKYTNNERYYYLDNLITRKPERFVFSSNWDCYLIQEGQKRLLDDPHKWLIYQHDPDDENPYGTSVLKCCYWAWMFKKAGFEFWLLATEKFSVKTILALFEMTGNEEDIQARANTLAELLEGVVAGSGSALGNVKDIREIGSSGHVAEFNALIDACDVQIAYGLTSQSVATNNPDKGTQALGTVSADIMYGDAKGIALELQTILQKIINWIVEINFGADVAAPVIEFDVEKKPSLQEVLEVIDRGFPVSTSAMYDYYKLFKPRDKEDTFVKTVSSYEGIELSDSNKKKRRMIQIP